MLGKVGHNQMLVAGKIIGGALVNLFILKKIKLSIKEEKTFQMPYIEWVLRPKYPVQCSF